MVGTSQSALHTMVGGRAFKKGNRVASWKDANNKGMDSVLNWIKLTSDFSRCYLILFSCAND